MKIQFNDHDQIYTVTSFRNRGDIVILKGEDIPTENTSGFKLLDGDRVAEDYSEYKTKYNVITREEGVLMLSTGAVETEDNLAGIYIHMPEPEEEEIVEEAPLTNEELTEAVADLMYEVSMMQLGL